MTREFKPPRSRSPHWSDVLASWEVESPTLEHQERTDYSGVTEDQDVRHASVSTICQSLVSEMTFRTVNKRNAVLSLEWTTRDGCCDWHGHRGSSWKKGEEREKQYEAGDSHDIGNGVT